jgi:hypothetical protein
MTHFENEYDNFEELIHEEISWTSVGAAVGDGA